MGHQRGSHLRVVGEGAFADDDVLRIRVHVGHRGKVDVEAIVLQVGADGIATLIGIRRIPRLANGLHRLILLHIEFGVVCDAGYATTLLVDAEQRRTIKCLDVGD